ncbi:MAG: DUF3293 domain-containing protein [Sulfuricurvum sp.]|uniref:DUF3293 domain-containing protein n=1 Tax=Sulfuricurvum sp. TaxID=2025608 RepID=UPI00261C5F21|nr:DUF3293 domain-containing protein [Sulfuricurvum sp.]MDD5160720.1 DUF3293 domain-containing protein [Sulfuricurvum sp.]
MKDIYDNTHFRISHNGEVIDFTIDTLPTYAPFDAPFAILTAWNPNNQPLSLEENTTRNEQLFEKLLESGYPFDEALGYLDDHSEESYCIYDITFEEAIELAKAEEQYAIFYRSSSHVGYYECETGVAITERTLEK